MGGSAVRGLAPVINATAAATTSKTVGREALDMKLDAGGDGGLVRAGGRIQDGLAAQPHASLDH